MPQMNPGGKFVFGASVIRPDGRVQFPPQAVAELPHCFRGQNLSVYRQPEHRWFLRHAAGIVPAVKTGAHSDQTPALLHYEPPLAPFSAIRAGSIAGRPSPEPVRSDWPRTRWSSCIWNPVCSYSPSAAAILPLPWAQRGRCWTERRNSQARFRCSVEVQLSCCAKAAV